MEESCSFQVYPTPGLKAEPYQNIEEDEDDCKLISQIKEDTTSDAENHSELSDDGDENTNDSSYKTGPKHSTSLQKAKALIKKQQSMLKTFKQKIKRANEKISLQNKVLNDLMEIYGLKHEDIAVLKAEILRAEKLESNEK